MAISFKAWTHPATGEKRVYINGVCGQQGAKVFICGATEFAGTDFKVRVQADWMMDRSKVEEYAYDAIGEKFGRSAKLADILAAVA